MINCRQATELMSKSDEKNLSVGEKFKLYIHLTFCRICKLFSRQNKLLIQKYKGLKPANESVSADFKKKVIERLNDKEEL